MFLQASYAIDELGCSALPTAIREISGPKRDALALWRLWEARTQRNATHPPSHCNRYADGIGVDLICRPSGCASEICMPRYTICVLRAEGRCSVLAHPSHLSRKVGNRAAESTHVRPPTWSGCASARKHVRWQCPVAKPERGLLYARNMLGEDSCTNMQGKEVRVAHTGWRSLSGH